MPNRNQFLTELTSVLRPNETVIAVELCQVKPPRRAAAKNAGKSAAVSAATTAVSLLATGGALGVGVAYTTAPSWFVVTSRRVAFFPTDGGASLTSRLAAGVPLTRVIGAHRRGLLHEVALLDAADGSVLLRTNFGVRGRGARTITAALSADPGTPES